MENRQPITGQLTDFNLREGILGRPILPMTALFFVSPSLMVETPRLQAKPHPSPSPWMGEGGDGGESCVDDTPTFILPPGTLWVGGGEFSFVGFQPTT